MLKSLHFIGVASAMLSMAGCTTMINGTSQRVQMLSEPPGAEVFVADEPVGTTPTCRRPAGRRAGVTVRRSRYGHGSGQPDARVVDGQHRSMRPRRKRARTGSARGSTMLARLPQRADTGTTERLYAGVTVRRSRYGHGSGQPDARVVDGQHRSMRPRRSAPGPDRLAVRRCLPDCRNARIPEPPNGYTPADCHGPLWTGIIAWSETWYIADREVPKLPTFIALFSIFI